MNAQCTMLGFARRAGKLVAGYDAVLRERGAGTIRIIFLASDLSKKTADNIHYLCETRDYKAVTCSFTMDEAADLICKRAGVFGITDRHMEARLAELAHSIETEENA